ncbi:enoyl-CoA hydratase/isomerase family protein [Thalassovita sp.]|uniref:enoyl-CoA hydratase/isomerase family protein n=1 Tax=Thalassovita sp. TaxID=1979401 RepID=UPI0029DE5EFF|nr:enoyl-CoA hydratase-related protein [Thalassovita sp.]
MSNPLRITRENGVVQIELMEARSRNALSDAMRKSLHDTMHDLSLDTEMSALILTGSDGVFCAGGDLKKMLENHRAGLISGAEDYIARMRYLHSWVRKLRDMPVPVIVAVDGPAFGAGLGLALTGDIILASDRATFNASFCKVGAVPDGNLFYSLPRMIGLQRAREMFYTGRTVGAEEAQRLGICMEVTTPEGLLSRAWEIAAQMTQSSPTAFGLTKAISGRSLELASDELLEMEAQAQAICLASEYHRDALDRFTRKEAPRFNFR